MKKVLALVSALFLLIAMSPDAQATVLKSGAPCVSRNQVKISGNKKYTCAKTGSKLRWKVSAVKPIPTPISDVFSSPIPIKLPITIGVTSDDLTFSNISNRVAEISMASWQKSQEVLKSNSQPDIQIDMFVGPNTQIPVIGGSEGIKQALRQTVKLWSGFSQSKYISIYVYNVQDEPWAEDQLKLIGSQKKYPNLNGALNSMASTCRVSPTAPLTACRGSNSGSMAFTNDAHMEIGVDYDFQLQDLYFVHGGIIAHEYTHSAQAGVFIGSPKCGTDGSKCFRSGLANNGFSPCWLYEGLPQSAARIVGSSDFALWNQEWNIEYNWGPTTVTDYSELSILNYLTNLQNPATCYGTESYKLGYSVGALTTQALIAIGGPQAVMALYALGADGEDFPTAFRHVYGLEWSEAAPQLAKVLAQEYAQAGPAPH